MAARQPDKLAWKRTDIGRYDATGRDGDRWHVVQAASRRWEVYRNGCLHIDAVTMADAKWYAEQEDDPVARETRDRLRRAVALALHVDRKAVA